MCDFDRAKSASDDAFAVFGDVAEAAAGAGVADFGDAREGIGCGTLFFHEEQEAVATGGEAEAQTAGQVLARLIGEEDELILVVKAARVGWLLLIFGRCGGEVIFAARFLRASDGSG